PPGIHIGSVMPLQICWVNHQAGASALSESDVFLMVARNRDHSIPAFDLRGRHLLE
ncbi:12438_t:CDS:2, partial [Acaulospora morrowiae]